MLRRCEECEMEITVRFRVLVFFPVGSLLKMFMDIFFYRLGPNTRAATENHTHRLLILKETVVATRKGESQGLQKQKSLSLLQGMAAVTSVL